MSVVELGLLIEIDMCFLLGDGIHTLIQLQKKNKETDYFLNRILSLC